MTRRMLRAVGVALVVTLSGCASVIHGTWQTVEITSQPSGATARVLPGDTIVTTPASVELPRKQVHTVRVEMPGYCRETVYVDRMVSSALMGNLLIGGFIGTSIDVSNGAAFELTPDPVAVNLRPAAAATTYCDTAVLPLPLPPSPGALPQQ